MDNFYEQLVTTKKSTMYNIVNTGTYVVGVLGLLFLGGSGLLLGIILIALAVGLYFIKGRFYVEYEYDLTNGEIDIDKIIEMKKRKRVISFSVKDLELLAPEDSYHVKDFSNKPDKVLKLYPDTSDAKVYVGMLTGGMERAQIRFVPNEELLEYCYKYNPRAVKRDS